MSDFGKKCAIVGVAAGLVGVAAVSYLVYKENEEKENMRVVASRPTTIEMQIPKAQMRTVIGRGGQNINEIRGRTHTKIFFKDEQETEQYCVAAITGLPDDVKLAEIMIFQTMANQPMHEVFEFLVDNHYVGRIIGRGGQMISSIQNRTGCNINISDGPVNQGSRRVTLRGTKDQMRKAKCMIEEIIQEEESYNRKKLVNVPPLFLTADDSCHKEKESILSQNSAFNVEELSVTYGSDLIELYVSSVIDPGYFYVQKVGPKSIALDKLVSDMTIFYDNVENRLATTVSSATIGDVVAIQVSVDGSWYRGTISEVISDDYDESIVDVSIDYVDFGGCDRKPLSSVCKLEEDFLQLDFQAIAASLADLRPSSDGGWSASATEDFESLTHASDWKPLLAKVIKFKLFKNKALPCLTLIDANAEQDIDINQEMVHRGHAISTNLTNDEADS